MVEKTQQHSNRSAQINTKYIKHRLRFDTHTLQIHFSASSVYDNTAQASRYIQQFTYWFSSVNEVLATTMPYASVIHTGNILFFIMSNDRIKNVCLDVSNVVLEARLWSRGQFLWLWNVWPWRCRHWSSRQSCINARKSIKLIIVIITN